MNESGIAKWVEIGRDWKGGGMRRLFAKKGVTSGFIFASVQARCFICLALFFFGGLGGRSLLFSCVF